MRKSKASRNIWTLERGAVVYSPCIFYHSHILPPYFYERNNTPERTLQVGKTPKIYMGIPSYSKGTWIKMKINYFQLKEHPSSAFIYVINGTNFYATFDTSHPEVSYPETIGQLSLKVRIDRYRSRRKKGNPPAPPNKNFYKWRVSLIHLDLPKAPPRRVNLSEKDCLKTISLKKEIPKSLAENEIEIRHKSSPPKNDLSKSRNPSEKEIGAKKLLS